MLFIGINEKLIRFETGIYYNFQENDRTERLSHKKWSSYKERKGNALAPRAEEGRDKLRKAAGSCK